MLLLHASFAAKIQLCYPVLVEVSVSAGLYHYQHITIRSYYTYSIGFLDLHCFMLNSCIIYLAPI